MQPETQIPPAAPAAPDPKAFALRYFPHLIRMPFSPMHLASFERHKRIAAASGGLLDGLDRSDGSDGSDRSDQSDQSDPSDLSDSSASSFLTSPVLSRRGTRYALAAPRGHAKSTLHTLILPIFELAHRRELFIVILSATVEQASSRLNSIRSEIASNDALRRDFPHLAERPAQSNRRALTIAGMRIEAHGSLCEIRGLNFNGVRPTRIILDDAESGERSRHRRHRERLAAWYDEVVENLGDRYTHIEVVGTILHHESLLATLMRRPGWENALYRAVVQWSPRADLWSQWTALYCEPGPGGTTEAADAFLEQHRDAMLEGAVALWPEKEDYVDLMRMLAVRGHTAFFREKQNDPVVGDERLFNSALWRRFRDCAGVVEIEEMPRTITDGSTQEDPRLTNLRAAVGVADAGRDRIIPVGELETFGYLDPSLGRPGGDLAALVTIGRERGPHPRLFVLDAFVGRRPPSEQIDQIIRQAGRWKWTTFGFEGNGFQSILGEELQRRLRPLIADKLLHPFSIQTVRHTEAKDARIARVEPLLAAGRILFNRHLPPEFLAQLEEYGAPRSHDDAPDALAAAIELARRIDAVRGPILTISNRSQISL